jgi:hypothetical protein
VAGGHTAWERGSVKVRQGSIGRLDLLDPSP